MTSFGLEKTNTNDASQLPSAKIPEGFWLTLRTNVRLQHQAPLIQPVSRQQNLPLSFNQERLWVLEQLHSGTSVHNLLHCFRLQGLLNVAALEQSLAEIARRHEILRTTFSTVEGQPVQIVEPALSMELPVVDLGELPVAQRETASEKLALEEAQPPFDLATAPLWRLKLLRLAEDEHILIRTIHHIIFDGLSHSVFLRELGILYDAFASQQPSPLKELPVQYADYAYTQRQWLQGKVLSSQLDYWKQQLSGNVSALELPIDRPRPLLPSYQGGCQSLELSEDLTKALKALSLQEGVSLFVTLLAGFKTLLYQYTEQEDMIVCSPVAGRHRAETKKLIGYFNNVVVMRTDLSRNPSFRELLGRVSEVSLGVFAHQDTPLQRVAELPNLARTPLTRGMFVLQNTPNQSLELDGLVVSSVYVNREIANFDLSLSMEEKEGKLTATMQYKTDLFEATSITKMLEHFPTLLESLVANPDCCLKDLPLLAKKHPSQECDGVQPDIAPEQERTFVAPRNEVELQLAQIWEQVLGIQPISVKDNFFEIGGYSLLAIQLFGQIDDIFDKELPLAILLQAPTIEQLASILGQEEWSTPWSSLVAIQPHGSRPPLFCSHALGASILNYRNLVPYLNPDQPVYGLQPVGIDGIQEPLTRIEDMAAHYIQEIQSLQPQGPYFLAGHSFGGLVAYEIARQLHMQGQKVGLLGIFDTITPEWQLKVPPFWYRFYVHGLNLSRLEPREKLGYLQQRLQETRGKLIRKIKSKVNNLTAPPSPGAIPKNYQRIEEIDREALKNFVPQIYPGCLTIFRAIERESTNYYEPQLGWRELVTGGIEIHDVPGHHLTMILEPRVPVLAEKLQACLDKATDRKL